MKRLAAILLTIAMALGLAACSSNSNSGDSSSSAAAFSPRLDTGMTAAIEIAGFMGNFEALDQAMNAFGEIYHNVTFNYDYNSAFMLNEYMDNNLNVDIFMTNDQNIKRVEPPEYYVGDWCLDLSKEDINLSAVQPAVLSCCTVNGELLRVPLAMNPCGIVVNKTLLKDNGLEVPTTYSEFLSVMEALKEKGYTPIQGSEQHVYGELMIGMIMNILAKDKDTTVKLEAGDTSVVDVVKPVFERLTEIIDKGYTDYDLNCTYPADNYDGSIMGFFEGNMPFYVCTAECVSGMKKRESKSETFTAKPFEYEYLYAPIGDEGAYAYTEPWYGFSVNKNSKDKDIAVEFMRFLTTADRLTSMASIKGMPASTTTGADERYTAMKNQKKIAASFSNDGSVSGNIWAAFMDVCRNLGAGAYASADEAAQAFVEQCTLSNVKAF